MTVTTSRAERRPHSTEGLGSARPRLRGDVVLGPPLQRGPARVHQVRVLGTGRTLEVGAKEHFVMARLDGRRSLEDVGVAYQDEFGAALAPAHWGQILGTLHRSGLLATPESPEPAPRPPARGGRHALRVPREPGRPRTLRVVSAPERLLDAVLRATRAAFSPWLAVPLLAGVAVMEVLLAARLPELAEETGRLLSRPGPLLLAATASWLLAAVHELAHGVAARRYGVPVLEIGVRWLPPLVMPYCRTGAYLYLPRRRSHVVIAGSGVLTELALLLPAFAWWWSRPGGTTGEALAAVLLCGSAHALLNLAPVPPLDGYRMLSHGLGVTDLARHTGLFLLLAARRDPRARLYPRRVRVACVGYGLGAVGAAVAATGALVRAGYVWVGGWPGAVGVAAVLLVGAAVAASLFARRSAEGARRRDPAAGAAPGAPRPPASSGPERDGPRPAAVAAGPRVPPARDRDAAAGTAAGTAPGGTASGGTAPGGTASGGTAPGAALVLDGVVKEYGGRRVVDRVDLVVRAGEFLGLLGPNGAGKTTLVETAVGLRRADAGTVAVLGRSPWPRRTAVLRRIGVQTQSAAFFVRLTAREHLRTVAALYGLGPDAAERALGLVGLDRFGSTRAERLSGGQQQRLAIATALVHDPELVFLDEPTASLDPQARRELWSVLRELHAGGRTILYTTHHIDEAEALCTRVAIMAQGAVVASGAPYELIDAAGLPTRLVVPGIAITLDAARTLPGVHAAAVEGPSVVIETHHSAAVLERLGAVAGLRGVQTRTPTLEDVYLHRIRSELVP